MPSVVYVNGRYLPRATAKTAVEDRGYQFADGAYEVILALGGALLDRAFHLARLERSLAELRIPMPMSRRALETVIKRMVARNRIAIGTVYIQVTRGVAPRDHAFPDPPVRPVLVIDTRHFDLEGLLARQCRGIAVQTVPDLRWRRCDIKSIALTGNVLAKQAAREAGATEAWMVDEQGLVTEGASTTAWIVDQEGCLRTRALGPEILPGITRRVIMDLAAAETRSLRESPFTPAEARNAAEAFTVSTTSFVTPVTRIDGTLIANGKPGPVTRSLIGRHRAHVRFQTDFDLRDSDQACGRSSFRTAAKPAS